MVKTIANHTAPEVISIFPHIDIVIYESTLQPSSPIPQIHLKMYSWIPIIRNSVYLVPLIYNKQDTLANKEIFLKETKAQFLAEARHIIENYIIDDDAITKIESYGWYIENLYYKMDYGI